MKESKVDQLKQHNIVLARGPANMTYLSTCSFDSEWSFRDMPLFQIVPEFLIYSVRTLILRTDGFYYVKFSNKIRKW